MEGFFQVLDNQDVCCFLEVSKHADKRDGI